MNARRLISFYLLDTLVTTYKINYIDVANYVRHNLGLTFLVLYFGERTITLNNSTPYIVHCESLQQVATSSQILTGFQNSRTLTKMLLNF